MPYFKWVGVDIAGVTKKGKFAAHSSQQLSEHLFSRGISLLFFNVAYTPSFLWAINAQLKSNVFKHKAHLLRAGILLPKAIIITAQQSDNPILSDILFNLATDIQSGISFSDALKKQPQLCDPIPMVMLTAGYESGNVLSAIENVGLYYHAQDKFNKSVRSVLAIPFLTLLFFIGISSFIFIFIIPRFADMFQSLDQELPALTKAMINMSNFIRSSSMVLFLCICMFIIFMVYWYCVRSRKRIWDNLVTYVPFFGVIIWQHQISQVFHALSLLVMSGVTLVEGLKIVSESVDHVIVKSQLMSLNDEVMSGQLLSNAMAKSAIFLPEIVALIYVAEESGTLGESLEAAACVYADRLKHSMARFVFFLQPIVIILLGFLVTILIFAVYLPIMQLSYAL